MFVTFRNQNDTHSKELQVMSYYNSKKLKSQLLEGCTLQRSEAHLLDRGSY